MAEKLYASRNIFAQTGKRRETRTRFGKILNNIVQIYEIIAGINKLEFVKNRVMMWEF